VLGSALLGRWGLLLAVGFAAFALMSSSSAAPRFALSLYRARPLSRFESSDLYDLVAELARRADLPAIPRLYLSPHAMPNALSVGQPSQPIIVLTRGLLARLDGRELAGVLAHEVAHIRNRDLWLLGLADSIQRLTRALSTFGVVLLVLNLPLLALGAATVPFDLVLLLLFAPAASVLLALALSRTREFEADRTAAEITGDPRGLASALTQLERSQRSFWDLFLPRSQSAGSRLWRTHPAAEERTRRLLG
jgi:heat shock protein HtpX